MIQSTYLQIDNLLSKEQLLQIETLSKQATFDDGKKTASLAAKQVKHNLQMDMQSQSYMNLQQIILTALNQNNLFRQVPPRKASLSCK